MSASHFFEETGQLGEVLLPVHEFAASVPSAWDRPCLQLHPLWIVRIDSHRTRVVFFSARCELEGAVELATLQGEKLGLKQVERGRGPFPLHVGLDAQNGYLLELDIGDLHSKWFLSRTLLMN